MWNSLNDKSWPLADLLGVGNFFDDNIPPILLPIVILVLVASIFFFISSETPTEPVDNELCGDNDCLLKDQECSYGY